MRLPCFAALLVTGLLAGVFNRSVGAAPAQALPLPAPAALRCDHRIDPLGIDQAQPDLSWEMVSPDAARGVRQTAYQVLVSSTTEKLNANEADLWDSGLIRSDESAHVIYAGKPLISRQHCFWKVRLVDQDGNASPFSSAATWSMGMLSPSDWKAQWIGAVSREVDNETGGNGYLSAPAKSPTEQKWVQVDLGESLPVDQIVLHPAIPYVDARPSGWPGIARFRLNVFPWRYRVDVSDSPEFKSFQTVGDREPKDGGIFFKSLQTPDRINAGGIKARYVRVTATHLWAAVLPRFGPHAFGLGQLQVFSGGKNVALGKPVIAKDSLESEGFGKSQLTDGNRLIDPVAEEVGDGSLLLRKDVSLDRAPVRATAYVTGLGYYELSINGKKVGDHLLDPGYTDFSKRVQYVTYDVTGQLKAGENVIGATLGNGWYRIPTPDNFSFERAPWRGPLKLLVEIELEYPDGSKQTIASDPAWKWSTGSNTYNCVRGGETYDARLEKPGWDNTGYDDANWHPVTILPAPTGKLTAQSQPPIRLHQLVKPIKLTEPKPGVYVYDLGFNISGWARFKTSGTPGQKVTLQYNEVLLHDGRVEVGHGAYFSPSRFQTEILLCSGKPNDILKPKFTYHGFRYVQVTGLTTKPALEDLTGCWVSTDPDKAGDFTCSNQSVNDVLSAYCRTQLDNMESIPTDCPTREKLGWMEDGCTTQEAAIFNFDIGHFYQKWFWDMTDNQDANGHVGPIVPSAGWGKSGPHNAPGEYSCPWWGGAVVRTPWNLYQYYGDKRQLAADYPAMKAYVDYIGVTTTTGIVNWGLGDWLDETADVGVKRNFASRKASMPLTSTAAYFFYSTLVAKSAQILGKTEDAQKYAQLSKRIAAVYNKNYLNPATGEYGHDAQTAQAMSIDFDLVPAENRKAVQDTLIHDITDIRKGHLNTGIVGTLYLFHALEKINRDDVAYTVFANPTYPSLPSMLTNGATTFWESWSPPGGMSNNHPALGAPVEWLFRGLAGIRPDPDSPGFKHIIIKPAFVGDLTNASASYHSQYGIITSSWKKSEDDITLDVTIPANTTATVFLTTSDPSTVTEGAKPAAQSNSVKPVDAAPTSTAGYLIGSGHYVFHAKI